MLIGYLIPEFPGQTHIFFWRELAALHKIGIDVDLISTKRPAPHLISHEWSREAMMRTTYLRRYLLSSVFNVAAVLIGAGPIALRKCLRIIRNGDNPPRLAALLFVGAALAVIARRHGWRHIHVHSCADSANVALFASILADVTYSLTLHGPLEQYGGNQRAKWKHARFAIAITNRIADEVREAIGDATPPIHVCPMGVDLSTFHRDGAYEPYSGHGPLYLFSCGRLNRVKGHADLITALAMLRKEGIDARLTIAGADDSDGQCRAELELLAKTSDVEAFVEMPGALPESAIVHGLQKCHIFALLSYAEPLGVAIMEAMAMELPVVATDAGGVSELIDNGVDGVLVPPRKPDAAAKAIYKIARDYRIAKCLGMAARRKIAGRFESKRSANIIATELAAIRSAS